MRRIEDEDGFILPAKHLVARGTPAVTVSITQISNNTNHFLSINPTPEVADEEIPTEKLTRRSRIPPFFVKTACVSCSKQLHPPKDLFSLETDF
ncbi:hypothetical protein CEXT_235571 [Caerostris extrusa]|uniref:Uncharacterized protein n=1 Tax=Caerostris extrusa TaxID=172846 RepID=A0AAV4UK27_CAEEX|nr:hypothetical protein CEXT_235571 [Caerostris extrusa]